MTASDVSWCVRLASDLFVSLGGGRGPKKVVRTICAFLCFSGGSVVCVRACVRACVRVCISRIQS